MFKKFFDSIKESIQEFQDSYSEKVTQKCSCCGGQMEGNSSQQTLSCPYCGASEKNEHYKSLQDTLIAQNEDENTDDIASEEVDTQDDIEVEIISGGKEDSYVYAYIEKKSIFYNGEIPGLNFARAMLCSSEEECLDKLKQVYKREKSKRFYERPSQSLAEIKHDHPNAKIVKLK